MNMFKSLAVAACLALPAAAHALPMPIFESDGFAFVDLPLEPGAIGDFFDDGADELDISVSAAITDFGIEATLFVSDFGGTLLEGTFVVDGAVDIVPPADDGSPTEDTITMVFSGLSGSEAALFGDVAIAVFSFFEEDSVDGAFAPVTARIFADVAPIPLPASLPLLLSALGGGIALRRMRRR